MKSRILFLFFFVLILSPLLYSQQQVNYSSVWSYSYNDNFAYIKQNASPADKADLPSTLRNPGGKGFLWITGTIHGLAPGKYYLDFGKIEAAVEVYINGTLSYVNGDMPPEYRFNGGVYHRVVMHVITQGDPVYIAVRFFNDGNTFNINNPSISEINNRTSNLKELVDFLNLNIFISFTAVSLLIGIYYLVQFAFSRKSYNYLFFGLANVAIMIYFFELGLTMRLFSFLPLKLLAKSSMIWFFVMLTLFYIEYLNIYNKRIIKFILLATGTVFSLSFLFFSSDTSSIMNFFTLSLGPGAIMLVLMLIISIKSTIRRNANGMVLLAGVSVGIIAAIYDIYHQASGIIPFAWLQGPGIFLFDVCMFVALALENFKTQKDLQIKTYEVGEKTKKLELFIGELETACSNVTALGSDVNRHINDVAETFMGVRKNTHRISESAGTNFESVRDMENIIKEQIESMKLTYERLDSQKNAIETTTTAIDRMLDDLSEIIITAEETNTFASSLVKQTREGSSAIKASTDAITKIKETSMSIYEVIDAVHDIAERTNLLAMNAAIESAHAGKAGAGFAVVASEIRKLAEGSSRRVEEIAAHIKNIMQKIEEGVSINDSVHSVLENITTNAEKTAVKIEALTETIEDQKNASDTIRQSIIALQNATTEIKKFTDSQGDKTQIMTSSLEELVSVTREVLGNAETITEGNTRLNEEIEKIREISEKSGRRLEDLKELIAE